jgi:hypothetical protein
MSPQKHFLVVNALYRSRISCLILHFTRSQSTLQRLLRGEIKKKKHPIYYVLCAYVPIILHNTFKTLNHSQLRCQKHYIGTGCPKNVVLTVHYGVEEITINVRKMLKKFYWTYLLIWRSLKVALNRSIILKYMYEIVMAVTSHRTHYHKVQDHSLPISNLA